MDYNEKLFDFADGELDPVLEDEFYTRLATDEELKYKLKQTLLMKNIIFRNNDYFNPSAKETHAIFSTLGISTPINIIQNKPTKSINDVENDGLFKTYKQGLIGGMISSVITAIIVYLMMTFSFNQQKDIQFDGNGQKDVQRLQDVGHLNKNEQNSQQNNINYTKNIEHPQKQMSNTLKVLDIAEVTDNNNSLTEIKQPENTTKNLINPVKLFPNDKYSKFSPKFNSLSNNLFAIEQSQNQYINNESNNDFSLEFRGLIAENLPSATISPAKYSDFNNLSLSLFYKLSDDFQLGVGVRQETFYQKYKGIDKAGISNIYEQQPNFTTTSIILKYKYLDFSPFSLFAQGEAGVNVVGGVGRLIAGFEWTPYPDITFMLGIEYSNLIYGYQKNIFNSKKIGLNYGVNYKL